MNLSVPQLLESFRAAFKSCTELKSNAIQKYSDVWMNTFKEYNNVGAIMMQHRAELLDVISQELFGCNLNDAHASHFKKDTVYASWKKVKAAVLDTTPVR